MGYYNNMKYDVAIIGAGPAGLTAGIFASRAGLKTICFERLVVGGQAALSANIENYPGIESMSGVELMQRFHNHSSACGVEFKYEDVVGLRKDRNKFIISTKRNEFIADKVIIASGCKPRKLNLERIGEFVGRGVSYCASCDGNFFKNKIVAVVGGGNSAVENVKYLSNLCKKVYMLNRSERFRAHDSEIAKIKKLKNVEVLTCATVKTLIGEKLLEGIEIEHCGNVKKLDAEGLFIAIGYEPDLEFLNVNVKLDSSGYIIVDENQNTNIKNLFACGDITSKKFKQVITACADGARAGNSCIGG